MDASKEKLCKNCQFTIERDKLHPRDRTPLRWLARTFCGGDCQRAHTRNTFKLKGSPRRQPRSS